MIKHLFVDMDGVIANFVKKAYEFHGKEYQPDQYPIMEWDIEKAIGVSTTDFWDTINSGGSEFWSELDLFDWSLPLIDAVNAMNIEWSIASCPSRHGNSAKGKIEWLQKHFGSRFRDFYFCKDKFRLASHGHVLLDDNDTNCKRFKECGGHAVLFPQPWNGLYFINKPVDQLECVLDEIRKLNECL